MGAFFEIIILGSNVHTLSEDMIGKFWCVVNKLWTFSESVDNQMSKMLLLSDFDRWKRKIGLCGQWKVYHVISRIWNLICIHIQWLLIIIIQDLISFSKQYNNRETQIVILYSMASIQTLVLEVSTLLKDISTALMLMFIKEMQIALKWGRHYKWVVIKQKHLQKKSDSIIFYR